MRSYATMQRNIGCPMNTYVDIFKALSDATRIRILHLFIRAKCELCVCELTDSLEVPQYNISRHLKILKHAGLLTAEKDGRWVYFRLARTDDPFVACLLKAIEQIPETILQKDLREWEKRLALRTNGRCRIGIQKKHLVGTG